MVDIVGLAHKLRVAFEKTQRQELQGLVKPLHAAFHGPKMKVYAAKIEKIKAEKVKKEKEEKEKLEKPEKPKKEKT